MIANQSKASILSEIIMIQARQSMLTVLAHALQLQGFLVFLQISMDFTTKEALDTVRDTQAKVTTNYS